MAGYLLIEEEPWLPRCSSDFTAPRTVTTWTPLSPASSPTTMRGVTIFGIRDDHIAWGRLYLEDVDVTGQGIDQAVRHMTRGAN